MCSIFSYSNSTKDAQDSIYNIQINSTLKWNFDKYLVDKNGVFINYFFSTTKPLNKKVTFYFMIRFIILLFLFTGCSSSSVEEYKEELNTNSYKDSLFIDSIRIQTH